MFQFFPLGHPATLQAQDLLARHRLPVGVGKWFAAIALAIFLTLPTLPAHAGRPMATDDAAVLEAGSCQLEAWTEHAPAGNTGWLNPSCNPFGSTEFALGVAQQRQNGDGGALYSWQVKHLLSEYNAQRSGFAIATGGQHARASGDNDIFVKGLATMPLIGEALLAHANLGAIRQHQQGKEQSNYRGLWGVALDAAVLPATRASLETYGNTGTRANWQLGLRRELIPGRLQLDTSVGSPYGSWRQNHVISVGLVFVSPPFLR